MKNILVVDNHPMMLKFMTDLLVKKGHQVKTAEDGLGALDVLKTYTPDVVFTDLIMPNIDGEKLCRIIRGMPELKDAYLIIVSSIAADEELDYTKLGANALIAKGPFDKMAQHVTDVLDQLDLEITRDMLGKLIGKEDAFEREIAKELLTSKRHIEVILKNISEGVLDLTIEGQIVYANAFAVFLIGIPEEELLGSNFIDLFSEGDRGVIKNLLEQSGILPRTISKNSPMILNGKHVSISIFPVTEKDQKSFVVILTNVSEFVRLKAKLKEAQNR